MSSCTGITNRQNILLTNDTEQNKFLTVQFIFHVAARDEKHRRGKFRNLF